MSNEKSMVTRWSWPDGDAPTFKDMLKNPESFTDADGNPLTAEQAMMRVHAHISAGGTVDDKME
jgi:hypothetical protein